MALKFLNKKGWHTGSLRNIENVWKAEQKHEQEQKKLEELRKQIQEERERDEFRALQEQAGFVGKQERLEFLYDSGLSVGKGNSSSEGGVAFKALEESNKASTSAISSTSKQQQPGALFEDKPASANDAWRKLHSDPLLLIRQREQEALSRIKNNPVQMAAIRKSVEGKKDKDKTLRKKDRRKKESSSKSKHSSSRHQSDSKKVSDEREKMAKDSSQKCLKGDEHNYKSRTHSDDESSDRDIRRRSDHQHSKYREESPSSFSYSKGARHAENTTRKDYNRSQRRKHFSDQQSSINIDNKEEERSRPFHEARYDPSAPADCNDSHYKRRTAAPNLSEEERAAKLREMVADAELHEEQRGKRLRKAADDDAKEVTNASRLRGNDFLDTAQKSVYGAGKGGVSTIENSVRRRTYYSQGRSEGSDNNAFRR